MQTTCNASTQGKQNAPLGSAVIFTAKALTAAALFTFGSSTSAQSTAAAQPPLVLKSVGSFFVGGRSVSMTANQIGLFTGGSTMIDQMYVQYMVPQGGPKPSIIMVHGGTLTGASYETTPDGRMGWFEYFVRKGHPSYVVDQVGRGRSGYNHAPFNDVRTGAQPPGTLPALRRISDEVAWTGFRFGPSDGVKFQDTQFPVEAMEELAKQGVPDLIQAVPPNDPNYTALSQLAQKLGDAVLLGHSQSGTFPFETALRSAKGLKGLIAIEPPGCNATVYSEEQINKLAKLPILIVFGDHVDMQQPIAPSWLPFFKDCQAFVERINAAKGKATMLHTPSIGIRGNSHMIMQDKNNLLIADLIMDWLKQR